MFTILRNFTRMNFQRSGNGLMQLILIHGFVFIGLLLIKISLVLAGYVAYYQLLHHKLSLPTAWESFLQQPWSLFTHFWIHEDFLAMLWHCLVLYSFGQLILPILRSKSLVALYILGGIGGGIGFLLLYNLAPGFRGIHTSLIGSSASLYAVMVSTAILLPNFYFRFLLLGSIKVQYIVSGLILLAFFELSQYQAIGIAKLSGALIGYLYVPCLARCLQFKAILFRLPNRIRKKTKLHVTYKKNTTTPLRQGELDDSNQEAINNILDKVAASGYTSLTQEEKQQLFDAGQ